MKYLHFNILQKLTTLVTLFVVSFVSIAFADGHVTLRMSTPASATDQRSIALEKYSHLLLQVLQNMSLIIMHL